MKVVKINAIWCSGCLVMNKRWKNILKSYDIDTINLDYDMDEDEVNIYNVGDILPVFIFFDGDKEIDRVTFESRVETYKKNHIETNEDDGEQN